MIPPESWLQHSYRCGLLNNPLVGVGGQSITILDPGRANPWDGPDFLGATLEIDGLRYRGDVEIHLSPRDWFRHGHHHDQRYGQVVAHLVWQDEPIPEALQGRFVHVYLREQLALPLERWIAYYHSLESRPVSRGGPVERLPSLAELARLAEERFLRRAGTLAEYARDSDWESACGVALAEALGYRRNSAAMATLLRRCPAALLQKNLPPGYRSPRRYWLFWALKAGLLPVSLPGGGGRLSAWPPEILKEVHLVRQAAGEPLLPATAWRFAGGRPFNAPPWRLAALAQIYYDLSGSGLFAPLREAAARRASPGVLLQAWAAVLQRPLSTGLQEAIAAIYGYRRVPGRTLGQVRLRQFLINGLLPLLHGWAARRRQWGFQIYLEAIYEQFPSAEEAGLLQRWLAQARPAALAEGVRKSGFLQQGLLEYLAGQNRPGPGALPLFGPVKQKEKRIA